MKKQFHFATKKKTATMQMHQCPYCKGIYGTMTKKEMRKRLPSCEITEKPDRVVRIYQEPTMKTAKEILEEFKNKLKVNGVNFDDREMALYVEPFIETMLRQAIEAVRPDELHTKVDDVDNMIQKGQIIGWNSLKSQFDTNVSRFFEEPPTKGE